MMNHGRRAGSHGLAMIAAAAMLASCGDGSSRRDREAAASNFVPPATRPPEPIAGQRNGTSLAAYVGHYPRDAVEGVSFFDRTEVANALIDLVPEPAVRREMLDRTVTQVPVFRQGDRIAAHGCAPHNCAGHNWTVLLAPDGDIERASVCFHDAEAMGENSRWSDRRGATMRPDPCPQA